MSNRSAYTIQGDRHYSYQTIIKQTLPGGLTLGNVTKYSVTTSKHQTMARVSECDVLLDNVDKGTSDLIPEAIRQGKLSMHNVSHDSPPYLSIEYYKVDHPWYAPSA